MNTEALKALVGKVDGDISAMIEMFLDGERLVTRAELIECLIAKGEAALKSAAYIAQEWPEDVESVELEQEIYSDIVEALEALNVSPEEKAAAIAADAARPPLTPATPEQIDEMLRFMQQSSDPNIKQMADYVVNLNTIEKHEGTKH